MTQSQQGRALLRCNPDCAPARRLRHRRSLTCLRTGPERLRPGGQSPLEICAGVHVHACLSSCRPGGREQQWPVLIVCKGRCVSAADPDTTTLQEHPWRAARTQLQHAWSRSHRSTLDQTLAPSTNSAEKLECKPGRASGQNMAGGQTRDRNRTPGALQEPHNCIHPFSL